jgi:hypothetical protein
MRDQVINEMNKGKTEYRVHVKGKVDGEPETVFHTYKCNARPENEEEARKIAGDFQTIEKLVVEEVTTITKSRILKLE